MTSILAGIKMLFNPLHQNGDDSICGIIESYSNATNFSERQLFMNDLAVIQTETGRDNLGNSGSKDNSNFFDDEFCKSQNFATVFH
jgi:hypothetical protein